MIKTLIVGALFLSWAPRAQAQTDTIVGNRGTQTMNPDISFIIDGDAGFYQRKPVSLSGDDPDFGGDSATRGSGFTLQEAELGVQSNIDPYLRGDVFLTIPNLGKLEVEEAYITTTALPEDLQLKVGKFRSSIGRQNGQHLHMQDFTRRPYVNRFFLGVDGLSAPGAQLSYLLPLPFYSMLAIEALSQDPPDDSSAPVQTFGGGSKGNLTGVVTLKSFFPLLEDLSLYAGLNFAVGRSVTVLDPVARVRPPGNNLPTKLYGADLYLKYKPANQAKSWTSLAWQSEYFLRHFDGDDVTRSQNDGGMYTQLVYQFHQRWFWGVRFDWLGLPESDFVKLTTRYGTSLTFAASEFSRWRLYAEDEAVRQSDNPGTSPASSVGVMIQYEVSMGAHGAHPF